jgi:hypothetical protein
MKLKDLQITGGTVYLNIVFANETKTDTMKAADAVEKYGTLEVIEHTPYEPDGTEAAENTPKRGKKGTAQTQLLGCLPT